MSDPFAGIGAAVAAAVEADPGAYVEGGQVVAQAPTPDLPPAVEPTPDPDLFPREYVEQLRREAADYRTRMNEYLDRAGPLARFESDEDVKAVHRLVDALENPDEFAGLLEQFEQIPQFAEARARRRGEAVAPPVQRPLDPQTVEQIVEQRLAEFQAQQAQSQVEAQLLSQARELGYNPDADMAADVAGALAFQNLLAVAQAVTAGSLVEADRLIKGQTQAQAAALVQSARPGPSVLPAGQGVPAAQGIDVSQFKGPRALEGLEKHIKGMQRLGQM